MAIQVLVHTDNHIKGNDGLSTRIETEVDATLERFAREITRVEVHLHDLNANKHGIDKRCLMEARLAGHQPIAVSHDAESVDQAVTGAVDKLEKALDHTIDKLTKHKGRMSMGGEHLI